MRESVVLVTGATGNVGRAVVHGCAARGLTVRKAVRAENRAAGPGVGSAPLDFTDRSTWAPALAGCRGLFLMRPPPISDMKRTLVPFVDAAWQAGVEHVVFLSVAGAERMAWVPHRKVELHLEQGRGSWSILRPGFFAQNLEDAYKQDIVEDDRLYVPAGDGRVAFIDADDIGEVAAEVLARPADFREQALWLTGPDAVTFNQVATLLGDILGRPIRYEQASIVRYARHLQRRGLPWAQVAVQTVLHVGLRRGDAEPVTDTVARVLGRSARPLREFIRQHAEAWRR